jgi:hypothetical protein
MNIQHPCSFFSLIFLFQLVFQLHHFLLSTDNTSKKKKADRTTVVVLKEMCSTVQKLIDFNSSAPSTWGFLLKYIANINATQQLLNAQKSYKTTSPPLGPQ